MASVFSGHTHLVFGGLACFLVLTLPQSWTNSLLGLLNRHVCAPTHVCTHICIHVISLSVCVCVCVCVHVDITNICSYHTETSDPCPATQRLLCPFLPLSLLGACFPDSKTPVSHYPTSTFFSPVPGALFFTPLSLEIKYFLYLK